MAERFGPTPIVSSFDRNRPKPIGEFPDRSAGISSTDVAISNDLRQECSLPHTFTRDQIMRSLLDAIIDNMGQTYAAAVPCSGTPIILHEDQFAAAN